jgi:hypothetical protein
MEISNEGSLTISTYPTQIFDINKLNIPISQFHNNPNTAIIPRNFDKRIAHLEFNNWKLTILLEFP